MATATRNKTVGKELTTSNLDVYVTPLRYSTYVDSIVISNASATAVTFSLDWYDSLNNTYYTVAEQVLIGGRSIIQLTDPLVLQSSDSVRGLASSNGAITVSMRIREEYSVVM